MQLVLQMPSDLGECLIVRDHWVGIMGKRFQKAKTAGMLKHLMPSASVEPVIRLRLVEASEA